MNGWHTCTAQIVGGAALEVKTAELTIDDTWSPYAQATLTVVTPANLASIDPRTNKRIALTFGQTFPLTGAAAQSRGASLGIRRRTVNTDGTTTLELESDEAILQDLRHDATGRTINPTARVFVENAFTFRVNAVGPYALSLAPGGADATFPTGQSPTDPGVAAQLLSFGQPIWDWVDLHLQQADLRLWCDELGTFRLTQRTTSPVGALALTGTIIDAPETIDRDGDVWGDQVLMQWRWRDAAGGEHVMQNAYPDTGGGSLDKVTKAVLFEYDYPAPFTSGTPTAQTPAFKVWQRLQKRGRVVPVNAISNYAASPGQAVTLAVEGMPAQSGVVQAVTWRYPADEMSVTCRDLADA